MTHEYVIAVDGLVEPPSREGDSATAIGWAAGAILAVGSDEAVRAISRGDSTFLDLGGCVVTALPVDLARADAVVRQMSTPGADIGQRLMDLGLLGPEATLQPGSPADLAFWGPETDPAAPGAPIPWRLVASVRGGHFTVGDEHRGPFPEPV
jgi:hypothetical protein